MRFKLFSRNSCVFSVPEQFSRFFILFSLFLNRPHEFGSLPCTYSQLWKYGLLLSTDKTPWMGDRSLQCFYLRRSNTTETNAAINSFSERNLNQRCQRYGGTAKDSFHCAVLWHELLESRRCSTVARSPVDMDISISTSAVISSLCIVLLSFLLYFLFFTSLTTFQHVNSFT